MSLFNGIYYTRAGSRLEVSGKHGGRFSLEFDWMEEPGACIDCVPDPEPEEFGPEDFRIVWRCALHSSGNAQLLPRGMPPSFGRESQ
jgi:hypothetical protein